MDGKVVMVVDVVEFGMELFNMDKIRVMDPAVLVVLDVLEFGMELSNMDKIGVVDADMVVEVVEFKMEFIGLYRLENMEDIRSRKCVYNDVQSLLQLKAIDSDLKQN